MIQCMLFQKYLGRFFTRIIAAIVFAITSACASHTPKAALSPATITPQNGQLLSNKQTSELTNAIKTISNSKGLNTEGTNTHPLAIGHKAFTLTDRLTLSPKLPAGAVMQNLTTVFLLKTDGKNCFLTNTQNPKTIKHTNIIKLKQSRCTALKK